MQKTLVIDGKEVAFKASAATPIIYGQMFPGEDFLADMQRMIGKKGEIPPGALITFAKIAYVMAKQADPSQPDTLDGFLDQFEMFSIYDILPEIVELWQANAITRSNAKKKSAR